MTESEVHSSEPLSLLYPKDEHPTERARTLVRTNPGFQRALMYRVNQALYDNRTLPEILFPSTTRKKSPPTFDRFINAEVFAEEEAIEIERFAREYLFDHGVTDPPEKEIADTIDHLLETGALYPADTEQIDREEKWRRHLLLFADSLRQEKFTHAEKVAETLSEAASNDTNPLVADYFRHIIIPLIETAIRDFSLDKKYPELLETFYLSALCTFIPKERFIPQVQLALKYPEARVALAQGFLRIIETPRYEKLFFMWKEYGASEALMKRSIKDLVPDYLEQRAIKNGVVDIETFEKAMKTLENRGILTTRECRNEGFGLFARLAAVEIGKQEKFGVPDWISQFLQYQKTADEKGFCTASDFPKHPLIQDAAKVWLISSFEGGRNSWQLGQAASQLAELHIMRYDDAVSCQPIVESAVNHLIWIFTNAELSEDRNVRERTYLDIVGRYVKAKIATRTYFDNIPEIKKARKR